MSWSVKAPDGSERAGERNDQTELPELPEPGLAVPIESVALRDPVPEGFDIKGRMWVPVLAGLHFRLPGKRKLSVRTVQCYHTIDDIGYVLCETKTELCGVDPESQALLDELRVAAKTDKSVGKKIGEMRKNGLAANCERVVPRLAYLLDTTAQVFGLCCACSAGDCESCEYTGEQALHGIRCGSMEEMGQQLELLWSCGTVVVECTFIAAAGMSEEESIQEGIKRGHVSWASMRHHVEQHPAVVFVLCHFSKRYTDQEIKEHFCSAETACPENVVLWLDSGIIDFRSYQKE